MYGCLECGKGIPENQDNCENCGWTYNILVELDEDSEPVCLYCSSEIKPDEHYCSNCQNVVGKYTEYQPYEGIPFSYSLYGNLWKRIWYKSDLSLFLKFFYVCFLLFFMPFYIIFVPIEIYKKIKGTEYKTNET